MARRPARRAGGRASAALALAVVGAACGAGSSGEGRGDGPGTTAGSEAVWSPDTATVLFTSSRDGDADLWLQVGVAGEPVNLTAGSTPDIGAEFSPGGRQILFQTLRDGNREVYLMGVDGSAPTNLTRHPAHDLLAQMAPDGSRILFFSTRGEEPAPGEPFPGNLWVMAPDGSGLRKVTVTRLGGSFGGSWAPDGRHAVLSRTVDHGGTDLFELDVDTGQERRLTERPGSKGGARYAPDGRSVAFHEQRGDTARIAVLDLETGAVRHLTDGGLHYNPTWSPDGRWLLFTGSPAGQERYDLLAVPVEGGPVMAVVATPDDERYGVWAPARPSSGIN